MKRLKYGLGRMIISLQVEEISYFTYRLGGNRKLKFRSIIQDSCVNYGRKISQIGFVGHPAYVFENKIHQFISYFFSFFQKVPLQALFFHLQIIPHTPAYKLPVNEELWLTVPVKFHEQVRTVI